MVSIDRYESLRQRPDQAPVMYQNWRSLLFIHSCYDPTIIQKLLPEGLTVDTFGDKAWVGLVPFRMEGIRWVGLPQVPGTDAFPETNVRTYVHREGEEPGVWFFSLEAANRLACWTARRCFHLPYHHARMTVRDQTSDLSYESARMDGSARSFVRATVLDELHAPVPGSLEFFLVERYLLYAQSRSGLATGRVHHAPYPLRRASLIDLDDGLLAAAGIDAAEVQHVCFSPGVDVQVYPLVKAATRFS